jgi:hypothetical protein
MTPAHDLAAQHAGHDRLRKLLAAAIALLICSVAVWIFAASTAHISAVVCRGNLVPISAPRSCARVHHPAQPRGHLYLL